MQDINVNKVVLIGRIGEEPVLRYTQTNTAICSLRVVTTETFTNREGNLIESKSTHSVTIWGQKGEAFKNQAHANSRVFVEGSLRNRSYEDREGNTKWVTEINAQTAIVLGVASGQPAYQGAQGGYVQPQQGQTYGSQPVAQPPGPVVQQPGQVHQPPAPAVQQTGQAVPQPAPAVQQPGPATQQSAPAARQNPTQPEASAAESASPPQTPEDDLPF